MTEAERLRAVQDAIDGKGIGWVEVANLVARAEERGRRAGIEEAAKLCDVERETAWACSRAADARGDHRVGAADAHTAATAQRLAEAIRDLAPRDSGNEDRK